MWGTTPPWEMTTSPRSLPNLERISSQNERRGKIRKADVLFVVSDGELEVTRHDTVLLVITGSVASEFENLSCEILKDGSEVD